jgi:hypothetical protein
MSSTKLQNAANLAGVFAALVAAFAFYYGYQQFSETQKATLEALDLQKKTLNQESEAQAVDLFIKYNELMETSSSSPKSAKDDGKFWRDNRAVSIIETIFKLKGDDRGWRETAAWMLGNHADFLKDVNCPTYDPKFIDFVKQQLKRDVCAHG